MHVVLVFLVVIGGHSIVAAHQILCVYTTPSHSHFIPTEALLIGLAERGHNVTAVTQFPPTRQHANYRHIQIERNKMFDELMDLVTSDPGNKFMVFKQMPALIEATKLGQDGMLRHHEIKRLMKDEHFDLVILELFDRPLFGLGAHFNCPVILFCSVKRHTIAFDIVGNPYAMSYVPYLLANYNGFLGFKERVLTFIWYVVDKLMHVTLYKSDVELYNRHFPEPTYPTLEEMTKNISAIFLTDHFSQGDIKPNVPALIEVGGIQMSDVINPLPEDLQKWMDASENGVIYFSMGSNVKTRNIPEQTLQQILSSFGKLKLNVLWKTETIDIANLPPNVKTATWVSQTDVLQHRNLKLFITHGGFGSITECKYYGVPALVIPVFADQMTNAEQVVYEGWGAKLDFVDLTETALSHKIAEVLENPSYRNRAEYEKILYRDRPLTALETGVYWTEYIMRHHGAKHMQSNAIHLNFFQLHSLDVIGFLLFVAVVVMYIDFKILKWIWRTLRKKRKSKME